MDNDIEVITQLRNTLSKMELSLGAINDSIIWISNEGKIQWCNEKFSQLINKPHIKILGHSISDFLTLTKDGNPVIWGTDFLHVALENKQHSKTNFGIYNFEQENKHFILEVYLKQFYAKAGETSIVVVLQDITEKQLALKKIKFLAAFPENNRAPIFTINKDNVIIYSNKQANEIIDTWRKDLGKQIPASLINLKNKVIETGQECLVEESCQNSKYLFSLTLGAAESHVNIYGTNVTERKKAEDKILYLSSHDPLTGLYNRTAFEAALKKEIARSNKDNTSFAILLLDLDNFKTVNDTFGHHVGDQLLINVAEQLKQNIRNEDVIARLGGDEFIILLSNIKDVNSVSILAQKLINRFNKPFELDNHFFHATVSIGISVSSDSNADETALIKKADIALYTVKELGRNNYQFFTNEIDSTFHRRSQIETNLIEAINQNQFFLVYQPQYKMPDKKIVGIEALLRWNHPEFGVIMPADFIPIAENSGLVVNIGEWVLSKACEQYSTWFNKNIIDKNLRLAVNLSPKHLIKENFIESLVSILSKTRMPPQNLDIEVTESAVMTSPINLDPILDELKQLGVKLSIDDFGVGYSSLSRLKDLPVSSLKIDKSFIHELDKSNEGAKIVKSIVALGNSLGLTVIPEGVETKKQLDLLMEYKCHTVQGFYFGKRPLTAAEMTTLLEKDLAFAD